MTKLVICLLFFGLFTIQTVGQMNSDPAPGRSPGPPFKPPVASSLSFVGTASVQNDDNASKNNTIFNSHNVSDIQQQIPIEFSQTQQTTVGPRTRRIFISSEKLKPTSTINEQKIEINVTASDAINKTTVNRNNVDAAEYMHVNKLADQKYNDNITRQANNVVVSATNTTDNNDVSDENDTSCNDMTDFLNDVSIIGDYSQTTKPEEVPHLNIDLRLEHDVFDTKTPLGITCGLMYRVRLKTNLSVISTSKIAAHYSGEFLVEIVSAKTGRERGSFVGHILGNRLPISWFRNLHRYTKDSGGTLLPLSKGKNSTDSKWTQGNNANTAKLSNKACPDNKWRDSAKSHSSSSSNILQNLNRSTVESTESVNMWMINELCEHEDTIEFRVFFRAALRIKSKMKHDAVAGSENEANIVEAQHMVIQKTFQYPLHKDCQLILREMSMGTLEYTSLPLYVQDCLVHFPSYEHYQTSTSNTPPPGILVAMQRLNVPCNNGGFVRFSESSTNLCGKLEELPDAERNFHLDVRRRASVRFYKNPMFSLTYKLVDYCYNVTTSNESSEYYIQPRRRDSLECYFRIHVPYGNRIFLRLVTNNDSTILSHTDVQANWDELNRNGNIFPGVAAEEDVIYTSLGQNIDTQVINLTLSSQTTTTSTSSSSSSSSSSGGAYSNSYGYDASSVRKILWDETKNMRMSTNLGSYNNNNNIMNNNNNAQILGTASCRGIIIKVLENDHAKWSHCVNSTKYMRGFLIESTGNMLIVHLYKAATSIADLTITRSRSRGMMSEPFISEPSLTGSYLPAIYLSYKARPIPELASNCEFGWIAMQQFCVTAIENSLSWPDAEQHCTTLGGHLASIRNEMQQNIVNNLLLHSPGYQDDNAYWVGGSDTSYEGDFRWSDGLQFQYTNWFSGWEKHGHYNKQPNDDGLSSQDCIEMRRFFRLPPGVQTNRSPLTISYMWNDRDCNAKNFLICERAMSDDSLLRTWINDCNKTVSLTKEHPRASIWSPSFPRQYPDNANCFTTITAPMGYRIVLEFEELVIETEPGCTYDYLEISEPINVEKTSIKSAKNLNKFFINNNTNKNKSTTKTITNGDKNVRKRNSYEKPSVSATYVETANENNIFNYNPNDNNNNNKNNDLKNVINRNANDGSDNYLYSSSSYNNFNNLAQTNYQKLLHIFSSLYKLHTNFIIQTPDYPKGNPYFHHHIATGTGDSVNEEILPKRLCGDWSSKLKLLRYVSTGSYLGLHFLSDYSHHFGGYKAKTYMENTASECANERLKPYNGSCYLFVSYPEVDWWTAQQVCRAMGAKLSSVSSADEHRFITSNIRNQIDYSPQLIYWLGAELEKNGQFEWTDDTKMTFQGWLPGQGQFNELPTDATCLGLQWKMSPTPMLPSGLYWQSQKCNKIGGYVCKKPKESFGNFAFNNFTVTGTEGRLVSPAYPNSYPLNINYWIHIKSPERTRIIVQFQKIDLEPQDECLYDFVSIQDYDSTIRLEPGVNAIPMAMLTSDEDNLQEEDWMEEQQLNFKNMLVETNDSDLYAATTYEEEHGNRIMSQLQQFEHRKRLQQRKRRRRRRRRRRRSISATEIFTVSTNDKPQILEMLLQQQEQQRRQQAKKRNGNAQNGFHLLMSGKENQMVLQKQHNTKSSVKLKNSGVSITPTTTYTFTSDIRNNLKNNNYNNKDINEFSKNLNKNIGKSNAIKINENPKRRRRKRSTTTDIKHEINKNHKRSRRNTARGNNNINNYNGKGSKAVLDNAQTFLPYVRWCGSHDANMSKFDFVANANEVVINFHSDYSISGLGFSAVWKAIDVSACPLQTLTSREGSIISPNYPHFVLNNLDCTYIIQAPVGKRVWLEFRDFDLRTDALLEVDLGNGIFRPFHQRQHINDGIFVSLKEKLLVHYRTGQHPRGKGFQAIYHTVGHLEQRERVINLTSNATGYLYQLNYPHAMPETVDYTQHLVAPFGDNILLELHGVVFSENACIDNNVLEIYDNYAGYNGTKWQLCKFPNKNLSTGSSDYYDDLKITKKILVDDNTDYAENDNDDDGDDGDYDGQMKGRSMERFYKHNARRQRTSDHYKSPKTADHQPQLQAPPVFITSYLNTLHIRQRTSAKAAANLNATVRVQWDNNLKIKLVWDNKAVESCQPNPCQHSGKCVVNNGTSFCQCQRHFTGRFCGLTLCELDPCIFGKCELTSTNFKCHCQPGYMGTTCEQKQRPCAENPCEGRGMCFERNGGFFCRCHAWWEGHRCERRMLHIPYKPLSERMLQEPFWLGLITVFVVMAVIGLVWCAKRHFPEKIEKLLAEEADRNRPSSSAHGHHHHTSLREQLQFTSAIPQPSAVNNAPGSQRSLFNRLGIRKPSLLSLSSPNPTPSGGGAAARTFSLDDLLRPPPRRSPSPRKKRNNSTPVKKCAGDKIEILQHLVSPVVAAAKPKVSLGELISMSENRLRTNIDSESDLKETTFSENSGSTGSAQITRNATDPKLEKKVTFARLLNKVSAEMSSGSEIDINHLAAVKNSSALSLPTDIQFRTCSMPPSPCTNDLRSPHSTSSNQGSESLSSSDLALTDFGLRSMQTSSNDMGSSMNNSIVGLPMGNLTSRFRIGMTSATTSRPKVSSADSLLAMFRHLAIASASTSTTSTHTIVTANADTSNTSHNNNIISNTSNFIPPPTITTSVLISPSTTPTISSPQDDAPGDDESSTSSMYTPVSYSSGLSDSPILYRHPTTIEVPVLDALNAHRAAAATTSGSSSSTGSNHLHPPTILLEIPGSGMNNKCLSPIRELPTPMPSPALTPIMPRPQRVESPIFQDDPQSADADYTDDDDDDIKSDDQSDQLSDNIRLELPRDPPIKQIEVKPDLDISPKNTATDMFRLPPQQPNARNLPTLRLLPATPTATSPASSPVTPRTTVTLITIDIEPPTPEEKTPRPRDLIIPTLIVEQPSPTKHRHPLIIYPGSPPPQRASIGETSFMFPNKQQQKRLLKYYEKPTSLDFSCVPPMITVTANMSELESDDTDPLSPAAKSTVTGGLMPPNPVGMCYLSPFTMCSRADRTISESNLSSSGYSSMASPGPSRCGSSNPLFPNELDETGSGHAPGGNLTLHVNLLNRRKNSALASCKEHIHNGHMNAGTCMPTASHVVNHLERLRNQQRPLSDSETLSDEIVHESNDEGISTDHVDEKLEDSRLVELRFKELDMYTAEHMLIEVDETPAPTHSNSSSSSSSSALVVSCTQSQATAVLQAPPPQQMSQLQLPSIVIQIDGNEKGLSPVSSRSESPLSERAGMGRFSPQFYGRKDLLPFTDSDGLYDFPSSDGKGTSSHPLYTYQRRSSSKKRERKSSKCSSTLSPTKNQVIDDATKESLNTTSSPSSCSITHICNKYCHSHHHPCPVSTTNVQRKSPKRRVLNRLAVASSSSSSESIASAKEMVLRTLPRRLNSPNREKRPRKQESLSEDEVADALLRRISPSIVKEEHPPKPKCKINRLRAIGNQIRFLRRLEKSIKTRERLASPSDSCPEEITDEMDSPQATSPLLQPPIPTKTRLALCRQKRLPSGNYGVATPAIKANTWRSADCHMISDDLNSD